MYRRLSMVVFVLLFAVSTPSVFAEAEYDDNAVSKLTRGLANVVSAPVELGYFYYNYALEGNPFMTLVAGTFYGVSYTLGRTLVGLYEIVSFPCAFPNQYGPIIEPDYPHERFSN